MQLEIKIRILRHGFNSKPLCTLTDNQSHIDDVIPGDNYFCFGGFKSFQKKEKSHVGIKMCTLISEEQFSDNCPCFAHEA